MRRYACARPMSSVKQEHQRFHGKAQEFRVVEVLEALPLEEVSGCPKPAGLVQVRQAAHRAA
eukprot:10551989-Lingulodinium_polyedra.AAC.1